MKQGLMQIAVILDRSGSMASVRQATIEGFNGFLKKQKESGDDINFLLVQFDSDGPHDIVSDGKITSVSELSLDTFVPRGGTPLHDAMGWTITELGNRLSSLSESERPEKVMVVILTDGQENSSKEFTNTSVAALVKQQSDIYNWTFIFLGANQDAVLTAQSYNIISQYASTFDPSSGGLRSATLALNSITDVWKYSNSKQDVAFTDKDREDMLEKLSKKAQESAH